MDRIRLLSFSVAVAVAVTVAGTSHAEDRNDWTFQIDCRKTVVVSIGQILKQTRGPTQEGSHVNMVWFGELRVIYFRIVSPYRVAGDEATTLYSNWRAGRFVFGPPIRGLGPRGGNPRRTCVVGLRVYDKMYLRRCTRCSSPFAESWRDVKIRFVQDYTAGRACNPRPRTGPCRSERIMGRAGERRCLKVLKGWSRGRGREWTQVGRVCLSVPVVGGTGHTR